MAWLVLVAWLVLPAALASFCAPTVPSILPLPGVAVFCGDANGQDGSPWLHGGCRRLPHPPHYAVRACTWPHVAPMSPTPPSQPGPITRSTHPTHVLMCRYIETFQAGFDSGLSHVPVYFMQSDGGLTSVADFSGHKAILSGPAGERTSFCDMTLSVSMLLPDWQVPTAPPRPLDFHKRACSLPTGAGGYVGYAVTTRWGGTAGSQLQMIGFDMGGTSTGVFCMLACLPACLLFFSIIHKLACHQSLPG